MSLVSRARQRVQDPGSEPRRRIRRQAHPRGDGVCRLEADPPHLARQPVRRFRDHAQRLVAVGLVDLHRVVGGDAVPLQEHHHLVDLPLLLPGALDGAAAHAADPLDLGQPLRLALDDV